MRGLLGVSAFGGTGGQGIHKLTWDNTGDFYVRVRGQGGAFSLASPFHLQVTELTGDCANVQLVPPPQGNINIPSASLETLVLTDYSRLAGTAADKATLQARLASFVARKEVVGRVVDVSGDARVAAANAQADAYRDCPFAKNQVAQSIRAIVDRARQAGNPLQYVVLVGDDEVIPYFRHPDQAGLGDETGYDPPVEDASASQASLRLGYVLSQDDYGSSVELSRNDHSFPVPELAVGRLVATAADATGMLEAYLSTSGGVVATPSSALVTGYDFFAQAAISTQTDSIRTELAAGLGLPFDAVDALVSPPGSAQASLWTADQLRAQLLGKRHDLIFLGAHFSAVSALAADYQSRMLASELASSTVDLQNALVFSLGCHAGYNIVAGDAIPDVTLAPDFPRAFASKRVTLIAGTGYQYGDTDFVAYDERLYLEFSRQLRTGSGAVAVGQALMAAKQAYLASTPVLRGIDEKSLLETTLYGLPQLSINQPGARLSPPTDTSIVTSTLAYTTNPGATLGLVRALGSEPTHKDVRITPNLTPHTVALTDVTNNPPSSVKPDASYLSGTNDVLAEEAAPVLPLEIRNVSVPGTVLRGVGFRGSSYQDKTSVRPLTGAPATELRSVHAPFHSNVLFPIRPWSVNYLDALAGGATRLLVTPAQYISTPGADSDTLRQLDQLDFRLFYSNNTQPYGANTPGLDAAPAISQISAVPSADGQTVNFTIDVVGDPAAGIQEVWVTYTAVKVNVNEPLYGQWQSLDLSRSTPSTRWTGVLPLPTGQQVRDVRFMVQAVNGVGLVTLASNLGAFYTPAPYFVLPQVQVPATAPKQPTTLVFAPQPHGSGAYRESVDVSAVLMSNNLPLVGHTVSFGIGGGMLRAVTDANGVAKVTLPLLQTPHDDLLRAVFDETTDFLGAATSVPFSITRQGTTLSLSPPAFSGAYGAPLPFVATLSDASGRRLREQSVVFVVSGGGRTYATTAITDFHGSAALPSVPLPIGTYMVTAYFLSPLASDGKTLIPILLGNGQSITPTNDRFLPSSSSAATLVQTPREARATYTGARFASPICSECTTASVTVSATIRDVNLERGTPGGGDVRNATVAFVDRATGSTLCTAAVGLVSPAEARLGTAACTWTAALGTQRSTTYTVGIEVGGSYAHNSARDDVQVNVARPTRAHISGEGTLGLVHSEGQLEGEPSTLARFTVDAGSVQDDSDAGARSADEANMDGRLGRRLPGHVELIFHSASRTYRVSSAALTSLAIQARDSSPTTATLDGTARIEEVTDPAHLTQLDTDALLQLTVTAFQTASGSASHENDDAQRQSAKLAISVWRKSGGLWFASTWDGIQPLEQTLASGHLNIDPRST
jgi:hypothetical protein